MSKKVGKIIVVMLAVILVGALGYNYVTEVKERERVRAEEEKKAVAAAEEKALSEKHRRLDEKHKQDRQELKKKSEYVELRKIVEGLHEKHVMVEKVEKSEFRIKGLVELDGKLREFIRVRDSRTVTTGDGNMNYSGEADTVLWEDKDKLLGLKIGYFSDRYEYDGKFLRLAHEINPKSRYRKYTLFSEINSDGNCWVENPAYLAAAYNYLKEFPEGPFAGEVYGLLGGFYFSLHNFLYYGKDTLSKGLSVEGFEFLDVYVEGKDEASLESQLKDAMEKSKKFLALYIEKVPKPAGWAKDFYAELQKEDKDRTRYGALGCPD
ncbi:MAG: hypothetical protein OEV59_01155 [Deltaproteobacteria bacterium]|nr:hypothetical protein [Deltaproteobacteria bacterium]